jgi:hypothetical protein
MYSHQFQSALARPTPVTDDSDRHSLRDDQAGRTCLVAFPESAGLRFALAVQRAWRTHRAVNAGLLALSILPDDERRRLLDAWIKTAGRSSSFFAAEGDALLEFIARQLPDQSPELIVCRLEQLILRAYNQARSFEPPEACLFDPQRTVRRAPHAGVLTFPGDVRTILNTVLHTLLQPIPPPVPSSEVTALLVAPGQQPLCRLASSPELSLWNRLGCSPAPIAQLRDGCASEVIRNLLHVGALEYV